MFTNEPRITNASSFKIAFDSVLSRFNTVQSLAAFGKNALQYDSLDSVVLGLINLRANTFPFTEKCSVSILLQHCQIKFKATTCYI